MRKALSILALTIISSMVSGVQKDPTRPSSYNPELNGLDPEAYSMGLSVDAIFVRNSSRVAIINGMPITVGEKQFGAKLIAINSDSVIVEQVIDGVSQKRTIGINVMGEVKENATNNF
jgi:hypothetical protein